MREIDRQHADGGPANVGAAFQFRTVPTKVIRPFMASRVVKAYEPAGLWVDTGQIGTLVEVARVARPSEI